MQQKGCFYGENRFFYSLIGTAEGCFNHFRIFVSKSWRNSKSPLIQCLDPFCAKLALIAKLAQECCFSRIIRLIEFFSRNLIFTQLNLVPLGAVALIQPQGVQEARMLIAQR